MFLLKVKIVIHFIRYFHKQKCLSYNLHVCSVFLYWEYVMLFIVSYFKLQQFHLISFLCLAFCYSF